MKTIIKGSLNLFITAGFTAGIACTLGLADAQCYPQPSGLVAFWPMQGNLFDVAGSNNPSDTSGLSFVNGEVGLGVSFADGGYIEVPDSPVLENQTFSFIAWAEPYGPGGGGLLESVDILILKVIANVPNNGAGYGIFWNSQNSCFYFRTGDNGESDIVAADPSPAGYYYHVAGTYDGSTFKLYVNGVLEGHRTSSQTVAYGSSVPWTIGGNDPFLRSEGYKDNWNGQINDLGILNRALSPSEVANIYAAGDEGMCAGVGPQITAQPQTQVGYWGQSVTFSVAAAPISPPLNYQWQSNSVPILGATNPTLVLTNLQDSFAAAYTVIVTNFYGSVTSAPPANLTIGPAAVAIALYPGIQITGVISQPYGIQYSTNAANANGWIGLTNLILTSPIEIWYDSIPASLTQRFYRVLEGPISIP